MKLVFYVLRFHVIRGLFHVSDNDRKRKWVLCDNAFHILERLGASEECCIFHSADVRILYFVDELYKI